MKELYPKRAENLAARVLNGEAIVMNPADSTLFNLNQTATAIWLGCDGKSTLAEIVDTRVCPVFEVEREAALTEAEEFARNLAEHSILLLKDEPGE